MRKADPVADVTRNTHNYFAQGGNELVIGGKLTFLPGAVIEGGVRAADRLSCRQRSDYYCRTEGRPQRASGGAAQRRADGYRQVRQFE